MTEEKKPDAIMVDRTPEGEASVRKVCEAILDSVLEIMGKEVDKSGGCPIEPVVYTLASLAGQLIAKIPDPQSKGTTSTQAITQMMMSAGAMVKHGSIDGDGNLVEAPEPTTH